MVMKPYWITETQHNRNKIHIYQLAQQNPTMTAAAAAAAAAANYCLTALLGS